MIVNPSGPKCPIVGFLSLKDGIFVGVHLGRGYGYKACGPFRIRDYDGGSGVEVRAWSCL